MTGECPFDRISHLPHPIAPTGLSVCPHALCSGLWNGGRVLEWTVVGLDFCRCRLHTVWHCCGGGWK